MFDVMPRLAIFDLAGTTLQDDGSVARIFHQVLSSAGLERTAEEISQVRGASKREAFRKLAGSPEEGRQLFDSFMSGIRQHFAERPPKEVPGAGAVFAWLREHHVKVVLNTGFERETVDALTHALGWSSGIFDAVVCGDDVASGRPSPDMIHEAMRRTGITDPAHVLVVGDTVLDLQAGFAAKAGWVVGVTSGAHEQGRLLTAPHTHLVASVADLREIFR